MNVLIVDDQINAVNGLVSGICWDDIAISNVYTAYDVQEAKKVIETHEISILLSDIEMPGASGLDLFRWIKETNKSIECIFLTAYANFAYAKEAVQLGGFDYILQPARYEDVQNAVVRVRQKIIAKNENEKYSRYGKLLYSKKNLLLEQVLKKWFSGEVIDYNQLSGDLVQFQIHLQGKDLMNCILLQVIRSTQQKNQMEEDLLRYAFENILSELFEGFGTRAMVAAVDKNNYTVLLCSDEHRFPDQKKLVDTLAYFIDICAKHLSLVVAAYTGGCILMEQSTARINDLIAFKQDNVALKSDVFYYERNPLSQLKSQSIDGMKHWNRYLTGGKASHVSAQAYEFLDNTALNAESLKRFYQEFMQMLAAAAEESGISIYQIFHNKSDFEKSFTSYQSIEKMKQLIDYVTEYFEKNASKADQNYVDLVIQYINQNIEKDLRRSDIAGVINLNEDYLSRLFKKEMNISLKEFIMMEKMKVAQSLLRKTNFSVGMVAAKVGFHNFSHFSQVYKKLIGVPPAEDREL